MGIENKRIIPLLICLFIIEISTLFIGCSQSEPSKPAPQEGYYNITTDMDYNSVVKEMGQPSRKQEGFAGSNWIACDEEWVYDIWGRDKMSPEKHLVVKFFKGKVTDKEIRQ